MKEILYPDTQRARSKMETTIPRMTKKEFAQMLSAVVEQKLVELFGDPDEGLVIKERLRKRLLRQKDAVARGERGEDFATVAKHLGIG